MAEAKKQAEEELLIEDDFSGDDESVDDGAVSVVAKAGIARHKLEAKLAERALQKELNEYDHFDLDD